MTSHRFQARHLQDITRRIFMAVGTPEHIAAVVAEILVNANLTGHDSHGVLRIPWYLETIEKGETIPDAEPVVLRETPSTLMVDGRSAFGHYVARWAMRRAIEKAEEAGICCVSLTRLNHIGRLGEYAEQAARAGHIGIVTWGSAEPGEDTTVPYGGARGALGTNPIAAGVPAGERPPFVLDFATSAIAVGKIHVARSLSLDLPEACLIDKHGRPSVRPEDFYDGGFVLPAGGHKGYALSMLICLLGGLSGQFDPRRTLMEGGFMQVISVAAFLSPADYGRSVGAVLDGIKAIPPAEGFNEILTPGEPEQRARLQRLAEGIDVPETIWQQIERGAQKIGVSLGAEL
ncbi:MAG: Ldh family oxidoreductase [Armatimonadota bacterium]